MWLRAGLRFRDMMLMVRRLRRRRNLRERNMSGVGREMKKLAILVTVLVATSVLAACEGEDVKEQRSGPSGDRNRRDMSTGVGGKNTETGSLFGPGGIFGSKADKKGPGDGGGVAVNAYLWRASLDTINFIPFGSGEPLRRVIITDSDTPVETANNRDKMLITILD